MPVYMGHTVPAKRPMMKYELAQSNVPTKKNLSIKKDAPVKVFKKVAPTKHSEAVIVGKPEINKDYIKKATQTKPAAVGESSVKKTPEILKSKREAPTEATATSKISTPSTTKAVTQTVVKEEKEDEKVKPKEEHQELSPMLSCALDSELEDVMIKVWQELPDDPSSRAEEHVVEKFRNEAGDDLRNVIGLNITKRLLNIQSGLYAKLIFKMRPERGTLMDFIKKYNLKTFKRISDDSPIFAVQFSNFEEYDRVCKDRVIYCGQVRVNVKPCYNFRTCPPNLRSVFSQHDKNTTTDDNDKESNAKVKNKPTQSEVSDKNKESDKIQDYSNEIKTSSNVSIKSETSDETNTNIGNKINRIIIKIEKADDINKNVKDESNKSEKSELQVAQTLKIKTEPIKENENNKIDEVKKTQTSNPNAQISQSIIHEEQESAVKTEPTKDKEVNEEMDRINETITEGQITQTNVNQEKEIRIKTEPAQEKEDNGIDPKDDETQSKDAVGENETFQDEDILAFMSGGIVLDECSGSDVE